MSEEVTLLDFLDEIKNTAYERMGLNETDSESFNFATISKTEAGIDYIEYWLLINAYYDESIERFVKIDGTSTSFGIQMQAKGTYPGEGNLGYTNNSGINIWRNPRKSEVYKDTTNYDYSDFDNEHNTPNRDMRKLLKSISEMLADSYYADYEKELVQIYNQLLNIYAKIHRKFDKKDLEKKIKNSIVSAPTAYDGKVSEAATSIENDRRDYLSQKQTFIDFIADAVRRNAEDCIFPESPKPISGFSTNPMFGFSFNSEAAYHNKSVLTDFLSQMFVRDYANLKVLERIDTIEELVNAIKGCTDPDNIDSIFQGNLTTFLEQMCSCKNYIVDTSEGEDSLGNTLGEMSLAYFKYIVEQETERCVFLIDQPEDHISNNNISKKLLSYFNSIRNKKQIIIVPSR